MPLQNLIVIILASAVSLACYMKTERNRDAAVIAEAMHRIEENFFDDIDRVVLFEGAMQGMVDKLDEHSAYFPAVRYQSLQEQLDQQFAGVGIHVAEDPDSDRLVVLAAEYDTPADKAGMRGGDLILEIDGNDTKGMGLNEAVGLMRGKKGDPVDLLIQHKGDENSLPLKIVRDVISVPSILGDIRNDDGSWSFVLEENPNIGYVRLTTFGDRTADELRDVLKEIRGDVDGLIIDVRGNAGGYLKTAVQICDLFIDEGQIVSTRGRGGVIRIEKYTARSRIAFDSDKPIVVLVNGFSASASEILSACLQDHNRAKVAGERTWGKGTVQNILELTGNRGALKLTTASYWRPSGKNIHRRKNAGEEDDWGVRPDEGFEVKLTDEELRRVMSDRRKRDFPDAPPRPVNNPDPDEEETGEENEKKPVPDDFKDPQLQKAVDYLLEVIARLRPLSKSA